MAVAVEVLRIVAEGIGLAEVHHTEVVEGEGILVVAVGTGYGKEVLHRAVAVVGDIPDYTGLVVAGILLAGRIPDAELESHHTPVEEDNPAVDNLEEGTVQVVAAGILLV